MRVFVRWLWSILLYQTCYYHPILVGGRETMATTNEEDVLDSAWSFFEQGNEVDFPDFPSYPTATHTFTHTFNN